MNKQTEELRKAHDFFVLSGFDWDATKEQRATQLDCIKEEFQELLDAKSTEEERDALADLIVTIVGYSLMSNYDLEKDLAAVNESNFSKFAQTEEEAQATILFYKELNVSAVYKKIFDYFVIFSSCECVDAKGKKYPKGKILKSIAYKPPKLD